MESILPVMSVEKTMGSTAISSGGFNGMSSSFMEKISGQLMEVDENVKSAKASLIDHVVGGETKLHEVMMAMGKAEAEVKFYVQVRDRLMESYKEVLRMQV